MSTNPKQLYGDLKVKMQLVPPAAGIAIARGLAEGAEKYSPWNWRDEPVELMTYHGAIQRHLAAWLEGEDIDPDSEHGKTHLEGAIASLAILIDAQTSGNCIDNRPQKKNGAVLKALEQGARKQPEKGKNNVIEIDQHAELRDRVTGFMETFGMTRENADLGVGSTTLTNFLMGKRVRSCTIRRITEALDYKEAILEQEPDFEDAGELIADHVLDYLAEYQYDIPSGAMALNVSREVLDSVIKGQIPHPNIINVLGDKIPPIRERFTSLKNAWREEQRNA